MKNRISICSSLLVLALTMLVSVSAQAQAFNPIRITGTVTKFNPATCGQPGSITIADITLPIAAGAQVTFLDSMQVILSNGGLGPALVPSEVWQVMGNSALGVPSTVRNLNVYLDPQGRIRLQLFSTSGLTGSQAQYSLLPVASTARPFEITGVVGVVSPTSVTINGTTIPLAAALPAEVIVDPTNVVRISGTLDSSNRLTGSLVTPTYTTIAFPRLAPTSLLSIGVGLTGDVNAFDADGPIAGSVFIYNPLGSAAGQFLCDQSVERLVLDGQAALFFAPNFSMIQQIPTFAPAEFTFQRDQFGLIVAGSKK